MSILISSTNARPTYSPFKTAQKNTAAKMQTTVRPVCSRESYCSRNKSDHTKIVPIFSTMLPAGTKPQKNSRAAASLQDKTETETSVTRPLGNFSPCIWGDHFSSLSFDDKDTVSEAYANEIEGLKEQVRGMLMDDAINSMEKISLINTLHRLGLSYHFEKEIDGLLDNYFSNFKLEDCKEYDLYTISMQFQLLRQHGYKMSCDVFRLFTDQNGMLKESLANDVKGMLSLYEASQLRLRGEDILEEALAFTTTHLKCIAAHQSHHLAKQVARALEQTYHRGISRMEARVYISFYEEDKSHNDMILRFAKLDYNMIQIMYQKELALLSRWSKDREFPSKAWYGRDRVVECHLFSITFLFEPRYSLARIMLTKMIILITFIDDIYDSFGTIDELQLFQDAVDRWDVSSIDQLPDYMKFLYSSLLNLFDEFDKEMIEYGRSYAVDHTKEAMIEITRAFNQLSKWTINKEIPSFDQYNKFAFITAGVQLLVATSFMGMFDCANEDAFKWLQGQPRISVCAEILSRHPDDIVDREFDQRNGRVPSAVECYKEQYGVSEDEAVEELRKLITYAWKDLYEEYLKPSVVPLRILSVLVAYARSVDVIYKYDNGFTKPEFIKDMNTKLFVEPVPI